MCTIVSKRNGGKERGCGWICNALDFGSHYVANDIHVLCLIKSVFAFFKEFHIISFGDFKKGRTKWCIIKIHIFILNLCIIIFICIAGGVCVCV